MSHLLTFRVADNGDVTIDVSLHTAKAEELDRFLRALQLLKGLLAEEARRAKGERLPPTDLTPYPGVE